MSKVVLVTGGSRGIGAAVARQAAAAQYAVAINYVGDKSAADALLAELKAAGAKAITVQGDVAKLADVIRLFDETEKALGPVTHLVNSAGITGRSSRLDAVDPQVIIDTIAVNLTGNIFCAREAVKRMSTRHGGKGGVIVNLSSAAATLGSPGEYTWYAASKGGIDSFTIGLAKEVAEEGIRVVSVTPGMVDTEIHERSTGDRARVERIRPMIPMKRIGSADEIANAVLFMMSDAASYITGTTIRVSGGR
ncbi:MAG: SDR family oxidoreductase [Phyllobacteriaceae bacterium]|nr:SDR family oxidoreductase [Phyllobacteriaceae bacterium]